MATPGCRMLVCSGSSGLCPHETEAISDSGQAVSAVTRLWRDSSHICFRDNLTAVPSPVAGRWCGSLTGGRGSGGRGRPQRALGLRGHCHGGGSAAYSWKRASVWDVRRWSEVSLSSEGTAVSTHRMRWPRPEPELGSSSKADSCLIFSAFLLGTCWDGRLPVRL